MILDNENVLAGAVNADGGIAGQLITATGATLSTNTIDLFASRGTAQPPDLGVGQDLAVSITILQTLTSGGSATVAFELVNADNPALSSNLQVLASSGAKPFTSLVAKSTLTLTLSAAAPFVAKRYLGLRTVIATAALTNSVGWLFAALSLDGYTKPKNFASGYSVA